MNSDPGQATEDRRRAPQLREIFAGAYELVAPFFDPANRWNGQSLEHLAFRAMRENYPKISGDDIHVFLLAAKRVYSGSARHRDGQ